MRGSSPFQNVQMGSSPSSSGPPGPSDSSASLNPARTIDPGDRLVTSATSQSAQTVNPCRYSALHWGQIITGESVLQQKTRNPASPILGNSITPSTLPTPASFSRPHPYNG